MASFTNRSRYHVTVRGKPKLKGEFPFSSADKARAYMDKLKAEGHEPKLGQYEDTIEVRVRTKGHGAQHFTVSSYKDAELAAAQIESERSRGLFIDYTASMNVTIAQLIRKYLIEECPKHKGCEIETYTLNAMLVDSGDIPVTYEEQHGNNPKPRVKKRKSSGRQVRDTTTHIAWLQKPLALVVPVDIEEFIKDRLQSVAPATVDREIDLLAAVLNTAINTWRYHVAKSPMSGVRRPRYFNERDRRLLGDEEARLLAAARREDERRSLRLRLDELMAAPLAAAALKGSASSRKRAIAKAKQALLPQARATAAHIPLYETLVLFLLMTAARRGEALSALWEHVNEEKRYAYLPETKNGHPRKLALRRRLLAALARLPRDSDRIFPITVDQLRDAWARICEDARIDDLHIHDLRHEALSRIAESSGGRGGRFSMIELQAISGHRDPRMLIRYAHLCVTQLAEKMDEALDHEDAAKHKGRKRFVRGAAVSLAEVMAAEALDTERVWELGPDDDDGAPEPINPAWPSNVVPLRRQAG